MTTRICRYFLWMAVASVVLICTPAFAVEPCTLPDQSLEIDASNESGDSDCASYVNEGAVNHSVEPELGDMAYEAAGCEGDLMEADGPAALADAAGDDAAPSLKPAPTVSLTGDGEVTLTWSPVNNAESYAIAEKLSNGSFHTFTYSCQSTSYVINGLSCGVPHLFLVQAKINGVWSAYSDADLVACIPEGNARPEISAVAGNGSVSLTWGGISGAEKYAIAYRKNGASSWKTATYECKDCEYELNELDNGYCYDFIVQARLDGRWSSFTAENIVACTPYDPISPVATASCAGDGRVLLTWSAIDGADAYAVAEKMSDGTYKTYSYSVTGTAFDVSNLVNYVEHIFLVQARVNGRWSSTSDGLLVSCTPEGNTKPAMTATAGDCSIYLAWNAVSGAQNYIVISSYGKAYQLDSGTCSLRLTGLRNGSVYQFCVRANLGGRWTDCYDTDWVTCSPSSPSSPKPIVAHVDEASITLSWDAIGGATSYAIAVKNADGYRTYTIDCVSNYYEIKGLRPLTNYAFLVQAKVDGKWSPYSEADLVAATTANSEALVVDVAQIGPTTARLTWEPVEGATKYAVAEYIDGAYRTHSYNVAKTEFNISRLSQSTTHRFLVQAYVEGAWTTYGVGDLVSIVLVDNSAPVVTGECIGDGEVKLSWIPVDGATRYAIAELVGKSYRTFTYDCVDSQYTVKDLANGCEHYFLVQAFVNNKWSSYGDAVLCEVTSHGTIAPVVSVSAGEYSARLVWDNVPGASRYAVAVKTSDGYFTYTMDCHSNSYEVTGLNGSTTYKFLVQAFVNGKWSAYSSADLASTTTTGKYFSGGELLMNSRVTRGWYSSATNYLILVDTSRNEVGIYSGSGTPGNWNLIRFVRCTSGASSTPTVRGVFTVGSRGLVFGDGYSCWYWTQIYGAYLFHSVLYYPGSQSNIMDGRIGINASHGCVRLEIGNAKWIYDNIPSGTKVVIY